MSSSSSATCQLPRLVLKTSCGHNPDHRMLVELSFAVHQLCLGSLDPHPLVHRRTKHEWKFPTTSMERSTLSPACATRQCFQSAFSSCLAPGHFGVLNPCCSHCCRSPPLRPPPPCIAHKQFCCQLHSSRSCHLQFCTENNPLFHTPSSSGALPLQWILF